MEYHELMQICNDIERAQEIEYQSKLALDIEEAKFERLKTSVIMAAHEQTPEIFEGLKVAQIATKESCILNDHIGIKNALEAVTIAQDAYEYAKRKRIYHQNVFSITKAHLYNQQGSLTYLQLEGE